MLGFSVGPVENGEPGTSARLPVLRSICNMEMLLVLGLITKRKRPDPSMAIAPPCRLSTPAPATFPCYRSIRALEDGNVAGAGVDHEKKAARPIDGHRWVGPLSFRDQP